MTRNKNKYKTGLNNSFTTVWSKNAEM